MPITILVVDDDRDLRRLLARVAAREGHAVLQAEDGEQALALVRTERVDAISLDIQMPNLDGRDVMARLKRDPATRDIPVIIATSMDDQFTREVCLELGAADVVDKPFSAQHLVARLEYLASKRAGAQPG